MNKNSYKKFKKVILYQFEATTIFVYNIDLTKSSDCSTTAKLQNDLNFERSILNI